MRRSFVAACLCLACTAPNPAFDEPRPQGDESSNGETTDDGTTGDTPDDLPTEASCELQPSPGLKIELGDPARFGGQCPTGVTIWTRVAGTEGGAALLDTCNEGCVECNPDAHPLALFPLTITDHLPQDTSVCLALEARTLVGESSERCFWGALTIYDPLFFAPYVIATAHSSDPTPVGVDLLAGSIPAPQKGFDCTCEAVGLGSDACCQQADGSVEFWAYPFESGDVYPGDSVPLSLGNQAGLAHSFEVVQAQRVPTCNDPGLQLSWAVTAEL